MRRKQVLIWITIAGLWASRDAPAARATDPPVRISNYGSMQTRVQGEGAVALPLRSTAVEAEIVGVMSSVEVVQHFVNPYSKPIEATYVFPLPHRAAIYAMTMKVGARVIEAQIKPREQAQKSYAQAKQQGKTASLLDQERPNVFTMSVANIMPGDEIEVRLRYAEELSPKHGEYEFVFPMVVGPRYVGGGEVTGQRGAGWAPDTTRIPDASRITPRILAAGLRPGNDISVRLRISSGVALRDLACPSHKTTLERPAVDTATIELEREDRIPNRDFVVRYGLGGATPQATLLSNHDARGGHFLLMIQPRHGMTAADVAPREYVFVVDTSGSMSGFPIELAKQAMRRALAGLKAEDRFQIIRFDVGADAFARNPVPPSPDAIQAALRFVDAMQGQGGTEFIPALKLALFAPRDPARARVVVFLTDGFIGYEPEVLRFLRKNLGDANLFAVGIGSSVNRYLIDGMARIGHGEPMVLLHESEADAVIERLLSLISRPALTGIEIDWGGLAVRDLAPARPPDLFADRPLVMAGRFEQGGSGVVTVRGRLAGRPFAERLPVALPAAASASSSPVLSYLWARRQIGELEDRYSTEEERDRPGLERQITQLALQYNLMSPFTSFVAVDERVRNPGGQLESVSVPVALPAGVEEAAAPPQAFVSARLSSDQVMPGDPEVAISAPLGTTAVTLILPTGEIKACTRDARTGQWVASFLIPEGTRDGIYVIRVLLQLASGAELERTVRYQVDGTAPRIRLVLEPAQARPGAKVRLLVEPEDVGASVATGENDIGDPGFQARVRQDVASASALLPSGEVLELAHEIDGNLAGELQAPTVRGRHAIAVVARDHAGNKVRRVVWLTVE